MKTLPPVAVDFETEAIDFEQPGHAPRPVGVALLDPTKQLIRELGGKGDSIYLSWAHPVENNCSLDKAVAALRYVWGNREILCHNTKFDLVVAEQHLGLAMPVWNHVHDTMFSLYLVDPHAPDIRLKSSAERLLGMAPEEQDAVAAWLKEHGFKPGQDICKAPGKLVGRYAIGDVRRTWLLHKKLYPSLDAGMRTAYDRERRLMPILAANEVAGVRADVDGLRRDIPVYQAAAERVDAWLRKRLQTPALNLDSDAELADALDQTGAFTAWTMTEKSGKRSTAKKNMAIPDFADAQVALALGYRNRLNTVLSQSMVPWLTQAQNNKGRLTTSWNQVRSHESGASAGTRTGRLSCSRFQNISKAWLDKGDSYAHPKFLRGLPELPLVRRYILPEKGQLFVHRDFSQQEIRILAHYEGGALLEAYQANPRMDVHAHVNALISQYAGLDLPRRITKIINFRKIYGGGANGLAEALHCTLAEARAFVDAHARALPGVKELELRLRARADADEPIRTWGGRLYKCEEPAFSKKFGRVMTYSYKMLNYLIQGSAADCTKEALVRLHEHPRWPHVARLLCTVHDEINASVPKKALREAMQIQNEVMASIEFDVLMLSDGKVGPNWGELKPYVDP